MTHTEKLIQKTEELKGNSYGTVVDDVCNYHAQLFLRGDVEARKEFNTENGLSEFARPEKSIWRVCEIVEEIVPETY